MASLNAWSAAAIALLPPLALAVWVAGRATLGSRLAALQLATALATLILALLTFAFGQSAFTDLPLSLALLSFPGTLLVAFFMERWL